MSKAVFPGSFDPATKGHLDLIDRARGMFDELVVGVLVNSGKDPLCSVDERVDMLKRATFGMENVSVEAFDGLLVDFVDIKGANAVVRGVRGAMDFEYEMALAQANYKMNRRADTVFLAALPEYSFVSSSAVKEILRYGGNIRDFVPDAVYEFLSQKFM